MAWTLCFLALLSCYFSGVISQSTLTQPPSQSVLPGGTVKISCTARSSSPGTISWYQQRAAQAPRLVHYNGASSRGEGIPDRFSASLSGNMGYLNIADFEAEDEAIYFCADWDSNKYIFGGGTQLSVLGQPTVPPTVNVFPPSQAELRSSEKATLVCLIDGFYPGSAQVTWLADGTTISSGVQTTKPAKLNDKYAASSYLSMEKSAWERCESVSCKVEHEGKTFEKQVRRSECA